jgi:hypothetical protein
MRWSSLRVAIPFPLRGKVSPKATDEGAPEPHPTGFAGHLL